MCTHIQHVCNSQVLGTVPRYWPLLTCGQREFFTKNKGLSGLHRRAEADSEDCRVAHCWAVQGFLEGLWHVLFHCGAN